MGLMIRGGSPVSPPTFGGDTPPMTPPKIPQPRPGRCPFPVSLVSLGERDYPVVVVVVVIVVVVSIGPVGGGVLPRRMSRVVVLGGCFELAVG